MSILEVEDFKKNLFSDIQSKRLSTIRKIKNLPNYEAKDLLLLGLGHWDGKLRKSCAKALTIMLGESIIPEIIKAQESSKLPIKYTLSLISKYDCNITFDYANKFEKHSNSEINSLANRIIKSSKCSKQTFLNIQQSSKISDTVINNMNKTSDNELITLIQGLSIEKQLELYDSAKRRDYFKNRNLINAFDYANSIEGTKYLINHNIKFSIIGPNRLDAIDDSYLIDLFCVNEKYFYSLKGSDLKFYKYLMKRNLTESILNIIEKAVEPTKIQANNNEIECTTELSEMLKIDQTYLLWLYANWENIDNFYETFTIPKKKGGSRSISSPNPGLKKVQLSILKNILNEVALNECCQGFRKGRSIVNNAQPHVKKQTVINIDLKDFFPSISSERVYGLFCQLGIKKSQSRFLTRITTFEGKLPQGAPTSPMISNSISRRLDSRLNGLAKNCNANYSRYADDLSFSGDQNILEILPLVHKIIRAEGFETAQDKFRIIRRGNHQEVTGLTVNDKVSVPRKSRRKMRAAINHIENGKEIYWDGKKLNPVNLMGRLSFLKFVQPELGEKYILQFRKALTNKKKRKT